MVFDFLAIGYSVVTALARKYDAFILKAGAEWRGPELASKLLDFYDGEKIHLWTKATDIARKNYRPVILIVRVRNLFWSQRCGGSGRSAMTTF